MSDDGVTIGKGKCLKQTDKAILVELEDGDEPIWIPQSQVHDDSEVYQEGQDGDVVVNAWWAAKNGYGE